MIDMSDKNVQLAAQCWGDPETSGTEMDVRLAEAFAKRLDAKDVLIAELEAQLKEVHALAFNLQVGLKTANELITDAIAELMDAPEITPCNYDHDQVCRLNTQCNYVHSILADYANTMGEK